MRLPRLVRAISISLALLLMGCFGCKGEVVLPSPGGGMSITGTVTEHKSGAPASGIEVKLYTYHPNPVLGYLPPTGHVIGSDITTEQGEYQIEVNAGLFQRLMELDYNKLVVFVAPGVGGFEVIDLAEGTIEVDLVTGAPAPSGTLHKQLTDIIASILATPSSFEGQQVTVIGYYRGWDILGEAETGPPVTRSDWVIRDVSGAIYVSASSEAKPNGLDPSSRDDVDTILKLTGVVCVTAKGQPYLEATSIERLL